MAAVARSPFGTAVEGAATGLALGLIDIHSRSGDWFDPGLAGLAAGFVLALRHGRRSWQAWGPLGWCFYLMHRVAIAGGYRPPYVEKDAATALMSLAILWPTGMGLALGGLVRLVGAGLRATARSAQGEADSTRPAPEGRARARAPRRPLTVGSLMVIVALIGVQLAALRALITTDHVFGFGTIYSEHYSEGRFRTLRVGMTPAEVDAIIGRPLRSDIWNSSGVPPARDVWFYSTGPDDTSNYYRRWVLFEHGKVTAIVNDFWWD